MEFVHLHVHSQYSFLDGASTLDKLLEKTKRLDMSSIALTDHNRLTGAIKFYDKAKAIGIKPIIGAEIDIERGYHLTLLCKDITGYASLCQMLTDSHLSNVHKKPQVTRETLCRFSAGLIALSGCSRGEIPSLLKQHKADEARRSTLFYKDVFGTDFCIELIRYPSREGMQLSYGLIDFAREQDIPIVATNNVHYASMKEYRIKELLNTISQNRPITILKSYRTVEQYLKSSELMAKLFQDIPEAIDMTANIASQCNLELELGIPRFPHFNVPEDENSASYLRKLAYEGVMQKYECPNTEVISRLEKELETIKHLGFCGYFLVVWDIVRWAKQRGIRCQARGSAVDSLVVYALNISNVDPVYYNLLFERFMHSLRNEPPDIDLDVDRRRRDEIRQYIYQKYGADNVACVSTINTYMARGAIRDAGKALQLKREVIDKACSGIHYLSAHGLLQNMDMLPELKYNAIYKSPDIKKFLQLCLAIDGFPKHLSVHLGGMIIGDDKLCKVVPLERSSSGDIISQYDKDDIERLGLVKMDILSLPTITVIEDTIGNIKENRGVDISIDSIPRDDAEAFYMLREGKTIGVFQLESPAQREMAGRLLPECFHDIIVSISLVRPGPLKSDMDKAYLARRHRQETVSYLHTRLQNALEETLGVILYQEQVLKVAHDLAGMSYAEADGFRRAMTHDRTEAEMENMRASFIYCAKKNNVDEDITERVFEQLSAFAAYGFCKAHAAAYAILSYQTLWLKCHYPAEFFAAILSNQPMGYYPSRVLIAEARRCGVKILPLDINKSLDRYHVENGAIRIGLLQLKGITEKAMRSIVQAREKGEFSSLSDFVIRTEIGQPVIEKLIRVGAFDPLGYREEMLAQLPALLEPNCLRINKSKPLFEIKPQMYRADNENWAYDKRETLLVERELLSLDLSAHPLDFLVLENDFCKIKDLPSMATGKTITIMGSVVRYQTPPTRNGKRVVYIIMEDGTGIADVTVFSDVQEKCGGVLFRSSWLAVEGKIQRRGSKSLSIIAHTIKSISF